MAEENRPTGYERKFATLIDMCQKTKPGDIVLVATPYALGDDYEEIIESLNRLARAEVKLAIAR